MFNAMAGQLQDLVGSLEARVAARPHTQDLCTTLEVGQLARAIYQQGRPAARGGGLHTASGSISTTRRFYLVDDAQRYAVLVSGTGEVGQLLWNAAPPGPVRNVDVARTVPPETTR